MCDVDPSQVGGDRREQHRDVQDRHVIIGLAVVAADQDPEEDRSHLDIPVNCRILYADLSEPFKRPESAHHHLDPRPLRHHHETVLDLLSEIRLFNRLYCLRLDSSFKDQGDLSGLGTDRFLLAFDRWPFLYDRRHHLRFAY